MAMARMLVMVKFVIVVESLSVDTHLVKRPELMLYDIRLVMMKSVLKKKLNPVLRGVTRQELAWGSLSFCDKGTNTSPGQSGYPPMRQCSFPCMSPTTKLGHEQT